MISSETRSNESEFSLALRVEAYAALLRRHCIGRIFSEPLYERYELVFMSQYESIGPGEYLKRTLLDPSVY